MDFNEVIKKIEEEEAKTPSVFELVKFLKQFPDDRKVYINYEPDWKQGHFIKDMSFVVDMDTNLSHPQITVGKISIKF